MQCETGSQSGLVRTSQSTQTLSCRTRSVGTNTKPLQGEDGEPLQGEDDVGDAASCPVDSLTSLPSSSKVDATEHAGAAAVTKQKELHPSCAEKSAPPKKKRNCASRRRLFGCDFCPYTSNKSGRVRRHMMTHTGQKPFKCEECSATFRDIGNLRVHLRIHTGEKPYKCSLCPFQFTHSYSLSVHTRRHMSGQFHNCDMCSYVGKTSSLLARHMQKHEPVSCPFCSHVCFGNNELVDHIDNSHPRNLRGRASRASTTPPPETTEAGGTPQSPASVSSYSDDMRDAQYSDSVSFSDDTDDA